MSRRRKVGVFDRPAEAAHVVLDSVAHVMRCNHCGDAAPLSIIEGQKLDFAIRIMDAFIDLHQACKPKEPA